MTADARLAKPRTVFDREAEWNALAGFAEDRGPGPTLGTVAGRRRQGKTYLLEALTRATGGFYFGAQDATEAESLRALGGRLAEHTGASAPARLRGWADAVGALLALGGGAPLPVVVDGFPDLVRQSPSLPSVVHSAFLRAHDRGRPSRVRMILCGSVLPVMDKLFGRASPLRGLARLQLVVRPLDFRQAARFWGLDDPRLAVLTHAVVGGSPAYRHDYVCDEAPSGVDDFDAWVCRTVLNPRVPLYREARHLLEEEADHWDRGLLHSTLTAVASGCTTRGEVAERLQHPLTDVSRALELLQGFGLLRGEPDAFRPGVRRFRITEPLLTFDHAVVAPHRSALDVEDAVTVWERARTLFHTGVVPPHFAQVCREWATDFAAPETFGASPVQVSHGSLPGRGRETASEADVVVRGPAEGRPGPLLSVGLACWEEEMGVRHLEAMRSLVTRLGAQGEDVGATRPACYSGTGFSPELRAAERRGDVLLVGLDRLYGGG
ncbi:AAA family ATPase [Streptomyces meridianus]|uniref:ArsR family transcriptional regulator n=1 Tax=Streptomyces meridianus TaxID=2938945 RepID=A0ABT0X4P4_9ACTN|nr:ArsR family transcriptional regulator [Streptomyces meridianus]MCM2577220.1 ArsR family transcriptional regulator [Streptomyces meridianus]